MRRPNQQKRRLSRSGSRSVRLKVDPAAHVRSSAAGGLSSSTSFGFPTGCSCCCCTQGRCVCVLSTPGVCVCRPCARADACVLDLLSSPRPENVLIAASSKPPSSPPSKSHDNRLIIILHHRNTPITSGGGRNKECGAGSGTHRFLEWNWKVLRDLGAAMQWICGCAEGMIRKIWLPE